MGFKRDSKRTMVDGVKLKKYKLRELTRLRKEYLELKKDKKIDQKQLDNVTRGINDLIKGRITKD